MYASRGTAARLALALTSCSRRAPCLDELAEDGLAVAAARGGEAAHVLRVEAQVVSTANEVCEEKVVAVAQRPPPPW